MDYNSLYLKYKIKYLNLKEQLVGGNKTRIELSKIYYDLDKLYKISLEDFYSLYNKVSNYSDFDNIFPDKTLLPEEQTKIIKFKIDSFKLLEKEKIKDDIVKMIIDLKDNYSIISNKLNIDKMKLFIKYFYSNGINIYKYFKKLNYIARYYLIYELSENEYSIMLELIIKNKEELDKLISESIEKYNKDTINIFLKETGKYMNEINIKINDIYIVRNLVLYFLMNMNNDIKQLINRLKLGDGIFIKTINLISLTILAIMIITNNKGSIILNEKSIDEEYGYVINNFYRLFPIKL
jgi:hypothetical protein